ncbi:MAG: choice-of-anchor Q domain-containing protein [Bacteroidota bacterium]|nr:choice-of-anchor Q domain-containing protein [Bacteroidota bacterium]MDP4217280.1 choice-of-anchor Q domain-containing protein [Bacteroidota bacterium]MDP4247261.1 choice-of-anchor Q domain-containing protein [Bacteroidota bacterium]MDP4253960.1 choice-of-anchor Q domain-containing protein [Bacteroidota bacterium]MDP4258371.1 choice-of-anchor Q domain-containing protein [Bacteroidota bacterium]
MKLPLLILCLATLFIFSCHKDSFITSPSAVVHFSADTLLFDTVFTTTGSITQSVKVVNGNDRRLRLSDIRLMGGSHSFFSINVDGTPGPEVNDAELEAGDSLYIFVAVKIDPSTDSLPFIVRDSIGLSFNGNQRFIQLQAFGQNANYLRNKIISSNTTWTNGLPYVILGGLVVDSNSTLTIPAGCKVYLHADAPLLVDGTLKVLGSDTARVTFLGDRLDIPYKDFPGSWPGIYFRSSSINNMLQYAVIKNAYDGVVAELPSGNASPKVVLNECIIDNTYDAGIIGEQSSIRATNCLISNSGDNIELGYGGTYQFTHCTAVSYSNGFFAHTQPVLYVSNYAFQGTTPVTADLTAAFTNCIFWGDFGNVDNEVIVARQGSTVFSVNFSNCLWKVKTAPTGVGAFNMIANLDPLFDSVNTSRNVYDFHLRTGSPAIDKGLATGLTLDLDGKPRPAGPAPDLGCYEHL